MGCALPVRTNSTPAIKVVLTAPIPGKRIPSFPFGGAILAGFSIQLPCLRAISLRMRPRPRKSAYKQTSSIAHEGHGCKFRKNYAGGIHDRAWDSPDSGLVSESARC